MKLGRYQHYKGNFYQVLGVAHHSETNEEFVLYKELYEGGKYGSGAFWVRPKQMFLEDVTIDGKIMPRFKYIAEK